VGQKHKAHQNKFMLIGNYTHILDNKNRVSVPAKWRMDLGENVVITSGLDGSLFLFSNDEWQKNAEKLSSFGYLDKDSRAFARYIMTNAFEMEVDSHGRVLIPESLVKSANLSAKIVLAGAFNRVEIWNTDKYSEVMQSLNANAESLASNISKNVVE
jgi:MraZ protein